MMKSAKDFFALWQYDLAREEKAAEDFALELGFCPLHTWQLLAFSSPWGTSMGYPKLLDRLSHEMRKLPKMPDVGQIVRHFVRSPGRCRVCRLLGEVEENYSRGLALLIQSAEGREAWRESHGLCLRHLGLLISVTNDPADIEFLINEAARRLEEMSENMRRFARKTKALQRGLLDRNEEKAYLRAMVHLVGEKYLAGAFE